MNYVFGPVPSRRLGQSLGIDTIPLKTCNWNCVYCQLGRTVPLTNERREYIPNDLILAQVKAALDAHQPGEIDWITFVGSGEPTLHSGLGRLIRDVKALANLPIAVITNGALLYLPEVRQDLAAADAVLPSLDAGSADLYRRLNRPHPEATFERLIEGLVTFRREYQGQLWLEIMLVRGLNDTLDSLREILAVLERIKPDEVHINQPTRPPAETWVQPPDDEGLMRATAVLGKIARVVPPAQGHFDLSGCQSIPEAIVNIITRHPMSQQQIEETLADWKPTAVRQALNELTASGQAQLVERLGVQFWSAAPAHYPEDAQSQKTAPKKQSNHNF
jgi:wyosine [tRNA(Phe)-imidazoG37] synthetase (radical SAM superfamily)